MDKWLENHLQAWAERALSLSERADSIQLIRSFVEAYPAVIERGDTWWEIYCLAERNKNNALLPR